MDLLSLHHVFHHSLCTCTESSPREGTWSSGLLFNPTEEAAHLVSSRRWCPWPWVSPLRFCEAFWPEEACRLRPLAPPISPGTPLCTGYAPLGWTAHQSTQWIIKHLIGEMWSGQSGDKVKSQSFIMWTHPLVALRPWVQWAESLSWPSRSSACLACPLIWRFPSHHCQDRPWRLCLPGCWPPTETWMTEIYPQYI